MTILTIFHRLSDALLHAWVYAFAQGSGNQGLNKLDNALKSAQGQIRGFADTVVTTLMAVTGIVAIVGVGVITWKFLKGDREAADSLKKWVIGLLLLFLLLSLAKAVFF